MYLSIYNYCFVFLRVFSRFCEIQNIATGTKSDLTYEELLGIKAKYSDLCKCPELKVINVYHSFVFFVVFYIRQKYIEIIFLKENPFRKRICKAFASTGGSVVGNDGGEIQMTFDQFVLMYSVFSDRAPREMKIHYAFMIYGKNIF